MPCDFFPTLHLPYPPSSLPSIFSLSLSLFLLWLKLSKSVYWIMELYRRAHFLNQWTPMVRLSSSFPSHLPPLSFPPFSPSSLSHLPRLSFPPFFSLLSPTRERKTFFKGYRNIGSQPSTGTKTITMGTKSPPWVTTDNGSESNRKREMQLPSLHKKEGVKRRRLLTLRISHRYTHMQCTQWSICVLTVCCLFLEDTIPQDKLTMLVCKVWPWLPKHSYMVTYQVSSCRLIGCHFSTVV